MCHLNVGDKILFLLHQMYIVYARGERRQTYLTKK